jgi:hypothetical protein
MITLPVALLLLVVIGSALGMLHAAFWLLDRTPTWHDDVLARHAEEWEE